MNGIIGRKPWSLAMAALVAVLLALALGVIVAGAQPTAAFAEPDGAQLTTQANSDETQDMYRLYNPNSGEHFYTASATEKDGLVAAGWNYEGTGWVAPVKSDKPVYRLYNANAGDHHYTMSKEERDGLIKAGWNDEEIGWYSDETEKFPLYRQYNPNAVAGSHNYTTSAEERDGLVKLGWQDEDIAWYALGLGKSATDDSPMVFVTGDMYYHAQDCPLIDKKDIASMSRDTALSKGYKPCTTCNPA